MNEKIELGLNTLLSRDSYLLVNDVHERTVTHKLGEYYQYIFPEWNVDCEYNKFLGGPKTLGMNINKILDVMESLVARALEEGHITTEEGKKLSAHIDEHKKYINIAGYPIDTKVAKSLHEDIKSDNRKVDEIAGMVYIGVKEANRHGGAIEKRPIQPDIIVHHRGTMNNLVIIEAKMSTSSRNESWLFDLLKLLALTRADGIYRYAHGYFMNIPARTDYNKHSYFIFEDQHDLFTKVESRS